MISSTMLRVFGAALMIVLALILGRADSVAQQPSPQPVPYASYTPRSILPVPEPSPMVTATPTPTPTPTATPRPTPTPSPHPALRLNVGVYAGAYGAHLVGEDIRLYWGMDAVPFVFFSYADGGFKTNVALHITDERGRIINPTHVPHAEAVPAPHFGIAHGDFSLSASGYDLSRPGRYRIKYALTAITTEWADSHGYAIDTGPDSIIRVVRRYADVDPHFFPAPESWKGSQCPQQTSLETIGRISSRSSGSPIRMEDYVPGLNAGTVTRFGQECFSVSLSTDTFAKGVATEHAHATERSVTFLSEDKDRCGADDRATYTYRLSDKLSTHIQVVILRMRKGYIVARYERPDAAPDDPAALAALDAPCLLL